MPLVVMSLLTPQMQFDVTYPSDDAVASHVHGLGGGETLTSGQILEREERACRIGLLQVARTRQELVLVVSQIHGVRLPVHAPVLIRRRQVVVK